MNPKQILRDAVKSRRVWLGGEFEFPFGWTARQAYHNLHQISLDCGGSVVLLGVSIVRVEPPDGDGYYLLDWYDGQRPGPWRIDHFTCVSASVTVTRNADDTINIGEVT